ncbi:MAG: hypothetical protein WC655_16715 [Candidatus Hydrogenedentales bacterium]|jgi:hypothetical protein
MSVFWQCFCAYLLCWLLCNVFLARLSMTRESVRQEMAERIAKELVAGLLSLNSQVRTFTNLASKDEEKPQ